MSKRIISAGIIVVCSLILATTEICGQLHEKYFGCFVDNGNNQRTETVLINQSNLTIEICMQKCYNETNQTKSEMTFAAVNNGRKCTCRNNPGQQLHDKVCNVKCSGDSMQNCGGNQTDNVYSLYTVCSVGYFGPNCDQLCHCKRHLPCDRKTGICSNGCDDLWTGTNCNISTVCPVGFCGHNCVKRNGHPCRFNGSCINSTLCSCRPGWTRSACTVRACGVNNGDCDSDEKCEIVDLGFANLSMCRCKDGSYRDNNTCRPTYLHYVGCYKGSTTQFADVELPTSDTLTIEFCILSCRELNRTYSIIQGGVTCLCGDVYGQISPDAECQVPCAGNKLQYCGGKNTSDGTPIYVVYTAKSFLRQYIGCYKDDKNRSMERTVSLENTIDSCMRQCAFHNYTYAGMQHGSECFCGNSYDRYGPLLESSCNMPCSGNNSQICGAAWANSVYAVNNIFWCSNDTNCRRNEACNNIDLNYMNVSRCRCKQGYHRMTTWEYCTDVDECQSGTSTCNSTSENCVNTNGGYRCVCKGGFIELSGKCEDMDECINDSFVCDKRTELCTNTIGSFLCQCKHGYKKSTFGNCTDVDECESGNSSCNLFLENCVNSIGSYRCECQSGFVNINGKCEAHLHYVGCYNGNTTQYVAVNITTGDTLTIEFCIQKCKQLNKTYSIIQGGDKCYCGDDYGQAIPDAECQVPCVGNNLQYCGGKNTMNGTPIYAVYTAWIANWYLRQYIGCYNDTSTPAMERIFSWDNAGNNTVESCIRHCTSLKYTYAGLQFGYQCFCGNSYDRYGPLPESSCNMTCSGNDSQICGGEFANSVYAGSDILRCSNDTDCNWIESCSVIDLNYMNVSRCRCKRGFHRMSTWGNCTDVDECESDNSTCNLYSENCVNKLGSYRCECKDGFANISGNCEDNDECRNVSLVCNIETELCNNTVGSYLCYCKPGYKNMTFGNCTDVNECESDNSTCNLFSENCVNNIGGYKCECQSGFVNINGKCEAHLHYAGCYHGNTTQYVAVELPTSDTLTIEFCIQKCKQLNKTYTIIQGGHKCFCGDDYGQGIPDSECQVPCAGNKLQYCGGNNTVDGTPIYVVYTAGIANWFLRQYIGCYNDTGTPAMERKFSWENATNNTIESCTSHCTYHNYTYVGLQFGYQCFCGNSYDRYGPLPESSCNMTCSDNRSQICGGEFANSVYAGSDILRCSTDRDCNRIESCSVIDLKYMNISRCRCKQGFHRMRTWGNCTDVDECESGTSSCNTTLENCVNNIGSYRCECKDGIVNISGNCEDIDECRNETLLCNTETELCENTIGSYMCHCKSGYEHTTFGNCTDIDECKSGTSSCNPTTETCINNIGSYRCECKDGFVNNSRHCVDVNECQSGNSTCNTTTENCVNNIGSYRCECKDGFVKMSGKCKDNDECRNELHLCDIETQLCANTIGSYACHCKPGYENSTFDNCTDVDECKLGNSTCNPASETCANNIGSYRCECKYGFVKITGMCEDLDECKSGNSTCNPSSEKCVNNIGSYRCECNVGFVNISEKCEDIDECQSGTSTCNPSSENCINRIGSYRCECKDGFVNKSRYCEDVDECQLKIDKCDRSSENCINSIGSHNCTCREGFTKRFGKCEDEQNGAVVFSLGCLLVVITIAALVSVCLLRKRIFVRKENSESAVVDGHSKSKERKATGEYKETFVPLILMNHNNHKIPVGELPALFKTKKSDPGTLEAEFQSVPEVDSTKTCLEGRKKELKHRNRFMNIIPYDQNRVILLKQHKQFSDYINASFIKSYNSQEKLIATQGPNPDTLTHFWQMIHENNVGTVVMITNLIENGKKKCARYWPEYDGTMTFEDMTITLKLTETWPNYVIRHLQLIKGKITMEVKQWHFTVWPDHGVPSDVKGFLNFRRNVRQSMSFDKYTVVHCSAGVGRTGTFIAINYLLEQAEAEGMVDIVECLKLLRQQRTQMVQTLDQYEFIYAALATEFAIGKTIISAKDFDRTFRDLLVQNKLSGKTQLEIQFQVLQEQWAQKSDSANPFHVFAKSLDMSELSDFVQAVFVQSWKTKDAYIVPEYPDKATVNYFWTICLDYESKLVINLDNGQNSEPFFPKQQGESLCVNSWRLQCKSSENERYLTRLNVALTQFSESEYANTAVSTASGEVTLFNVKAYVNDTRLNFDAIHATYDAMKTFQSKNDAKKSAIPVVIVSRPNCILNGLFIAAFNAFDMLEEAKEVDLYQVSYDIKKSRSKFIPSLAAYEELHNIVNHRIGYTSPAAIYGNV